MTPSIPSEAPYIPEDDIDLQLDQCDDVQFDKLDDLPFEQCDDEQLQQCDNINTNENVLEKLASTVENNVPTNERILGFAFWTFLIFTLTQITFAFIAGSHAMIGDSVAMLVDSITYLFNYRAEHKKHQFDAAAALRVVDVSEDPVEVERIHKRNRRKMVLELEILTPTMSVTALMVLTIVVMTQAIQLLLLDLHRLASEQDVPNITIMLVFSLSNLLLDVLNIGCFARAKHLMGYSTAVKGATDESELDQLSTNGDNGNVAVSTEDESNQTSRKATKKETMSTTDSSDAAMIQSNHGEYTNHLSENRIQIRINERLVHSQEPRNRQHHHYEDDDTNLNMCSAYTHVFADTLRSVAVLVAAVVAKLGPNVTPEVADAFASVVVSLLILFSLVPLVHGLIRSVTELRAICREERLELSSAHSQ